MISLLKFSLLVVAMVVGMVIGEWLGPMPRIFDWDVWLHHEHVTLVIGLHHYVVGSCVTGTVLACTKVLRFPNLVAPVTVYCASIVFPMLHFDVLGFPTDWEWFLSLAYYQAPFLLGMFTVIGMVQLVRILLRPQLDRRQAGRNGVPQP